jgi:hypothetical protein
MRIFSLRDVSTNSSGVTSVVRKYESSDANSTSMSAAAMIETAVRVSGRVEVIG